MTIETALALLVPAVTVVGGLIAILSPVVKAYKAKKLAVAKAVEATLEDDKAYRDAVLEKLDSLCDDVAYIQRDSIERSYCMFVLEHQYCPSGMKESINDMYQSYKRNGYNHIAEDRVQSILRLPEFPPH